MRLEMRRPVAGGVDDIEDFDAPVSNAVGNDVRQAGDNQFARPVNASLATRDVRAEGVGSIGWSKFIGG